MANPEESRVTAIVLRGHSDDRDETGDDIVAERATRRTAELFAASDDPNWLGV